MELEVREVGQVFTTTDSGGVGVFFWEGGKGAERGRGKERRKAGKGARKGGQRQGGGECTVKNKQP